MSTKLYYSEFQNLFAQKTKELHVHQIKEKAKDKSTKFFDHFYKEHAAKSWYANYNSLRYVTINRLRANHYSLAQSLFRKNMIESLECSAELPLNFEDIDHEISINNPGNKFDCNASLRKAIAIKGIPQSLNIHIYLLLKIGAAKEHSCNTTQRP
ncbi:hypothetical protein TKK_0019270 [Trichogramma kaykai]